MPVPSEHPNHDLLADLAAEVLPDDLAGHVQDHVLSCALCAGLLADAESVRAMLLQVEPEQMPDEILVRLERAMLTARREDEAAAAADSSETRTLTRMPLGAEAGRADPGRKIGRSGPATGRIAASAATGSMATSGPKTSRLSRMSAPAQSARRQAIEEQKADRPSRFARLAPVLKIAAVVLVAVGAGAGALQLRGPDSGATDSASTAASGSAPLVAAVQSTTTDYAKKTLPTQVETLISNSQKLLLQGAAKPSADKSEREAATAPDVAAKSADAKAPSEPKPLASSAAGQVQGQLLRTPAALQACLTAIGAGGAQPVAVDLARYAGREAAIIVLPADGGGYDVWVVARDCRPGNDGTIDVINNVKP
jgi:hypothetical protein